MHKATLDFQLSVGHPVEVYCPVCFLSSSNTVSNARYCAYSHGRLSPISEYTGRAEPINEIEELPAQVDTECPGLLSADFWHVDPTGTMAPHVCGSCGYEARLPYPADCPTCRIYPNSVRMMLAEPWAELLKRAREEPTRITPKPLKVEPKRLMSKPKAPREGQLALF